MARYTEPHRAYHNLEHIADCLAQFDQVRGDIELPDEAELALWLHDVVYDPHAPDNEEQSAIVAAQVMTDGGLFPEQFEQVKQLILATKHRARPETSDEAMVMDIDLSILGREPVEFAAYEARIRKEYAWVPEADFREGRAKILESFLQREAIFHTAHFQARYEAPSRSNLIQSIANLRRLPDPPR